MLRGIGGEQVFHDRYRRESQTTRRAGVEVAKLQSVLDALQVFLPGVFVVVVVWIGARYAVAGRITAGELVAFYGYAAFLMIPLRTATEYANKFIRARVSASRVCRVLALTPEVTDPADAGRPAAPRIRPVRRPVGAAGPARCGHRDRERRPGRVGAARRPAGHVRPGARRRRDPGRRTPDRDGARRRTPPDRRLRHRRRAVLRAARRPARRERHRRAGPRAGHRIGRRHPRRAARGTGRDRQRARPELLGWSAAAPGAGAGAHRRPRDPDPGRADLGGRRAHRGPDRGAAAAAPCRPDHRGHLDQPADAGRRRRGRAAPRRPRRRHRQPRRAARARAPTTGPWSPGRPSSSRRRRSR